MPQNKLEDALQRQCLHWFNVQYPKCIIFSVPNGAHMHPITKNILKKHGLLNGVSDLIILLPNKVLFVELKKPKQKVFNHKTGRMNTKAGGKQSPEQKAFQEKVESLGFEYYLVDEFNDFVDIIKMHKTT